MEISISPYSRGDVIRDWGGCRAMPWITPVQCCVSVELSWAGFIRATVLAVGRVHARMCGKKQSEQAGVHPQMDEDAGNIGEQNYRRPFQVAEEGVLAMGLRHQRHAGR